MQKYKETKRGEGKMGKGVRRTKVERRRFLGDTREKRGKNAISSPLQHKTLVKAINKCH